MANTRVAGLTRKENPEANALAHGLHRIFGQDLDVARFDHFVNDLAELGCFVRFRNHATEPEVLVRLMVASIA